MARPQTTGFFESRERLEAMVRRMHGWADLPTPLIADLCSISVPTVRTILAAPARKCGGRHANHRLG